VNVKSGKDAPKSQPLAARAFHWLDTRTGVKAILKKVLEEPIPGGARMAYVLGSGLLFIFLLQMITGVSLALYYTPTAETAHTSVAYITKQVAGGAFLRSLHTYGSSAMIIVLALHFLQAFLYGSFKGRRELLWISGAVLSLLVLGMGFTGYLLPWDQKAYFATAVGTNVAGEMPLIGNLLTRFLRGGDTIGTLTLSRFYVAHVFLIPGTIFLFIGAHILLFRKAGPAGPAAEDPVEPKLAPEPFYPRQVLFDMGFVLLIMAILSALSYLHPATLGPIANPADTHFLPRPEWYYLPMFEWLKFWEGPKVVIGIVVIPGLLATAFFLMPFLDRRLERQPWRRPIPVLAVAVVVLGMVYLGIKSQIDDKQGPIAAQLALQAEQERAYSSAPFEPYIESPGGLLQVSAGAVDPLVAQGKAIFNERGCIGCHGMKGMGTAAAPSLVGVTRKYQESQLTVLLRTLNPRMRAGRMPVVDLPPDDMSALLAYLGALGTPAANVPALRRVPNPMPAAEGRQASAAALKTAWVAGATSSGEQENLSAAAVQGQQVFLEHGCFACHGPSGTGGRAPALGPLVAKLSDKELTDVLQMPNARMKAGGMPPVEASRKEIALLVAYLRTLLTPQTGDSHAARQVNAEPSALTERAAQPSVALAAYPSEPVATKHPMGEVRAPAQSAGRAVFVSQGCAGCHGPTAHGTKIAPSLVGVTSKFPGDKLVALLHNPTSKMRAGGMPTIAVNGEQMEDLVVYLGSLEAATAPTRGEPEAAELRASSVQPALAPVNGFHSAAEQATVMIPMLPLALRGRQVFQRNSCGSCHGDEGLNGTVAAPGLAGTASLLPESTLEGLLRHHSSRMRNGGMPLTNFRAEEMKAIVAYIRGLTPTFDQSKFLASGSGAPK
jgi:ubiquinol-cytochrome c reductase cytochrome b subunit